MVTRILRAFIVLQLVSVLIPTSSCSRKKYGKIPTYHPYQNDTLPSDMQITAYLVKGESKRFFYTSQMDHGAFSVTLITCTSSIRWSFELDNSTNNSLLTEVMETYYLKTVAKGVYTLQIAALERNTYVHIYVSTEEGGPQALQKAKFTTFRLLKRQRRKRLTVKWNPSLVDPQGTEYCLVVSSSRFHGSLCSINSTQNDPVAVCVGSKTHHTLSNLKQGQNYYFNLFAINHQSNFTYPYGQTSVVFDSHFKPITVKDGKVTFANLKKLDGKAVFRYKIGKKVTRPLYLFVIPCGGAVDVEVSLKDSTVVPPKRVEGFERITIKNPVQSARYYIKIFALNREELKKTTGVEIYATTKSPAKIPLPNLPQLAKVKEYESLRTCDSVTVAWLVAPAQKPVHYCLMVKEGKFLEMGDFTMLNQCGLENRLKKSVDFTVKYCRDIKNDEEDVIVQKVSQLKPGKSYIIQVTVKKPKGKTLSYDLLQVHTKPWCNNKHFEDGAV
ncbi:NDNF [Asbolus verrucosus]|uniref:Protein NDNF n=1 Tax=Asbolus verrucosus TaxID=1661398 RepID=A0A482V975_ASBVE|nr:NDNF [Asbolus verrucosus]